ncbi:MAG: CheR family methyltransferase [Gaiellaceae bacterium]
MAADVTRGALGRAAGLDLTAFRPDHVEERVRRALEREGLSEPAELLRLLRHDSAARERFRRLIAVPVSGLFRDPAQFDLLERELLPALLAESPRLTVWSAGCADGSELYSIALVLERLGALEESVLLGSDLLEENLAVARRGLYGEVEIRPALRRQARWERRDVVREGAPPGPWRLVLCRNLAIYLSAAARAELHTTLAGALAPGGVLMLGRSERLVQPAALGLVRVGPHAYQRARP